MKQYLYVREWVKLVYAMLQLLSPDHTSQAMLVGLIPGIGAVLSLFHLAVLYALYSFEYKWIYQGTCIQMIVVESTLWGINFT